MELEPILTVKDLAVQFSGFIALDGVDLEIKEGEIQSLIGPNGAGKTTLLNTISGNIKPARGRITFYGEDVTGLSPHACVRKGISRTFQLPNIMPGITVRENVWLGLNSKSKVPWHPFMSAKHMDINDKVTELCRLVGVERSMDELAVNISHGDQKILEIAMAMSLDGALLLLDEPTQGVSPHEIDNFMSIIKKVAEKKTILMVEHNMDVVLGISDRVSVLDHGRVIARNVPSEIINDEQVKQVYLGTAG